ncbi:MAG: type II toxin-antitoxin system HicB family antitoxin [Desulfuromusa sp.]
MRYGFNLVWSEQDEGFIATCPDFPGLSAFGETVDEVLAEAKTALNLFVESLIATGDELPEPTQAVEYSGQVRFRMPKSLHRSLVQKAYQEGVSLNTWMISLLLEKNTTLKLVDEVCSRIDGVEKAIHIHRKETKQMTFKSATTYVPDFLIGEEYATTKPHFT